MSVVTPEGVRFANDMPVIDRMPAMRAWEPDEPEENVPTPWPQRIRNAFRAFVAALRDEDPNE